jgi:TRAP-type transport system periplasmic protein
MEDDMPVFKNALLALAAASRPGVAAVSMTLMLGAASAQEKTYLMRITLPTINDPPHQLAKNFAAAVEWDSGGRIKGEVYPASQLGSIPRQIEGVQLGSIQAAFIPPEFFVGIDERFEVMAAPGLVDSLEHGQRVASDPSVLRLVLGLGAQKGLHGVGLYMYQPSSVISRRPLRKLADFKGKKIRIFASDFQSVAFRRLGATPVAMTLADVLPAIQQGTIDSALSGIGIFVSMQYQDASKYVTETNQPATFVVCEVSQKWYDSLPRDLREVVDGAAAREIAAINPIISQAFREQRQAWVTRGGELINLSPDERSAMMNALSTVAEEVSKTKPALSSAYHLVADAANRTR